jgi:hypothetical protein
MADVQDDIPQVFSATGEFVAPDPDVVATLSPERKKRLAALALAAENAKAAEAALKDATAAQAESVKARIQAEQILSRVRPARTQTDNARDFIRQEFETAQQRRR